ncbi:MAG: tRNA epoxyqueuosine(34) reductase QueG [Polyangiaceae bacterium]|nr:tRNA epoxyqueuosine(34) reductase QueG [Polyangiaceae bacterium]
MTLNCPRPSPPAAVDSGVNRSGVELREAIRTAGLALGFVRVGFTTAEADLAAARSLERWRAAGHAGELDYMFEPRDRHDPRSLLGSARAVIVVAHPHPWVPWTGHPTTGRIARYALGADYHELLRAKLSVLATRCAELAGHPVCSRVCVDAAPLLEHAFAARAGIGFTGRHTLTIVPGLGSHVLLGELLVDLALPPDPPSPPRCGSCTRCLDACPTGAIIAPYQLDARRCLSYLTIELAGPIPRELRPFVGDWVFGCDRCQEACPYNAKTPGTPSGSAVLGRSGGSDPAPNLVEWLHLGSKAHRRLVRGRVLHRVSRPRLARNAAVALGNQGDPRVLPDLVVALAENSSPLVRAHAAWSVGRLLSVVGSEERESLAAIADAGRAGLAHAREADPDPLVREEARLALTVGRASKANPRQ